MAEAGRVESETRARLSQGSGVSVRRKTVKKVILVGLVGSGKSSVARILQEGIHASLADASDKVAASARPHTRQTDATLNLELSNNETGEQVLLDLWDTPGFGDPRMPFAEILHDLVEQFTGTIHTIDRIVLCFKFDRLRAELARELRLCYDFFCLMGAKDANFLVCISFAEYAREEEVRDFMDELQMMPGFDFLRTLTSICTGFPDISRLKPDADLHRFIDRITRDNYRRLVDELVWTRKNGLQVLSPAAFCPMQQLQAMSLVEFEDLAESLLGYDATSSVFGSAYSWMVGSATPAATATAAAGGQPSTAITYADVVHSLRKKRDALRSDATPRKQANQAARRREDEQLDARIADHKKRQRAK
jgi:hypothetical protein